MMGTKFLETLQLLTPLNVSLASKTKAELILARYTEQQILSVSQAIGSIYGFCTAFVAHWNKSDAIRSDKDSV